MRLRYLVLAAVLGRSCAADERQLIQVHWPTTHAAPVGVLSGATKEWMPAFRLGLASLPEAAVVALSLSQPQLLGLSAKDAQVLRKLTEERYALMAKDSLFRSFPSALPYCFAEARPAEDLATVHVPKACTGATPCIVFLHGYGGSFLWNLHVLAEAFPEYLIVCPAYGMSCGSVPREYVRDAIKAAEEKLGFPVAKPALVGLSAGGFGACMLYADRPDDWRKMICLAAYAREPALSRVAPGMNLRFIAGAEEYYVIDGSFRRGAEVAARRGAKVDSFLISGCGHFFLLQKPDETIAVLRRWLAD